MAAILLTPPAVEPISLAEAKLYLRVEHDDDDAVIASLITAARAQVEMQARVALITQAWRFVYSRWPATGRLTLTRAPVRQLLSARVYDGAGVAQAINTLAFSIDRVLGVLGFQPCVLPAPGRLVGGIEIDIELGFGPAAADVPAPLRQAVKLLLAHWYETRGPAPDEREARVFDHVGVLLAPYRGVLL
jgi:uncharacterized phiE125 gp8 family phage protein